MNGWMSKIAGSSLALLLLVAICLSGYSSLLSHRLELARQQVAEQKKTLAQQAGLITTLRADDARNRAMMAEQQRREQQLRQQGEIYQRKLRDALKNDKCGNSAMPAAVIELLQQNAGARASRPVAP
ncbi:DUF2570 family protein [Serratia marcescens]|uniref:DUF2570 family protein n=1 Tax=Serratia marcescens TaxID=615 RepID=UPI00124E2E6C|nr:DUF2570 family protein [Serratia marcescens]QFH60893.1 DUF2570 domain-containing protein [Serratia marcescens]QFH60945.1 DUF2570 domain-containing protein [Serratia marcescens]QFH60997.1 DUF2570 domain-containing protein [Serratia marcescens]